MLRLFRLPALVLLAALAATGCGGGNRPDVGPRDAHPSRFAGAEIPSREHAPNFALQDQARHTVRLSDEHDRIVLVTFLYTHCQDVCPLIAEILNQALRQLGPDRSQVRVLAVSVDPEGDTRAAVRSYALAHRLLPQFHYLIGTRSELKPVWDAWHVAAIASDPERVDHTAYTALLDPQGRERAFYDAQLRARDVVHDVRLLLKEVDG